MFELEDGPGMKPHSGRPGLAETWPMLCGFVAFCLALSTIVAGCGVALFRVLFS